MGEHDERHVWVPRSHPEGPMTDAEATGLAMLTVAIWIAYGWAVYRGWHATKPPVIVLFGSEREP